MVDTYGLEEQINKCLDTAQAINLAGLLSVLEFADNARALLKRDTQAFFVDLFKRRGVPEYFQINEVQGVQWFNQERMDHFLEFFGVLFSQEIPPREFSRISQAVKASKFQLRGLLDNLSKN